MKGLAGLILLLALLALGILARTAEVTSHDLRIDQVVQQLRFPVATSMFLALTNAASEIVGVGVLVVGVVSLVMRKRRWEALRLTAMAGAAWVLAIGVKVIIARPRPPASLWALMPDSSGSFPSGHDTTACVVVLVDVVMAFSGAARARAWATAGAAAFAITVGASRVYLGDHYPTDVLGSWLAVGAAACIVLAVADTRVARGAGRALLRDAHIPQPAL